MHSKRVLARLKADVFPYLGERPISELEAPELLAALRRVEERGAVETAHRLRRTCGQIFQYAIATGRASRNPAGDLDGALRSYKNGHFAAVTDPVRLGAVLKKLYAYTGTLPVRSALKLMPMLLVRPGELRSMQWNDVDLDACQPSCVHTY
jgi:integrase